MKRWINAIVIILSLMLSCLAIESFLRFQYRPDALCPAYAYLDKQKRLPRFEPHPFLPYTGRANDRREMSWRYEFFGDVRASYHNNSYGFLGDEFRFEKTPGEIRILTFGGSTTWQMGIDRSTRIGEEKNTWPNLLRRKLADKFPQHEFTVYNLAQDGFASAMSVVNLAMVGVNLHPDFVLSYDGINDMYYTFDFDMRTDYANRFSHYGIYRSVGLSLPPAVFRSRLVCWLVSRTDSVLGYGANTNAFASVSPPARANPFNSNWWNSATLKNMDLLLRNLKTMNGISKEYNAIFIGATLHYFVRDKHRDELNQRLRTFFHTQKIPYFDADRVIPKGSQAVNTDDVHFSKEGTELMAEGFTEVVSEQMKNLKKAND
jgi:lysophospholipase L1-like esterase